MAETRLAELELEMNAVRIAVSGCENVGVRQTTGFAMIGPPPNANQNDRVISALREAYETAVLDLLPAIKAIAKDKLKARAENAEAAFRNECSKRAHET